MKKHLIAAAVAGAFVAPAMANVTVYGLADVGYGQTSSKFTAGVGSALVTPNHTTDISTTGAAGQQSGSRLGIRAEEDLGGGLKAGVTYELGVNPQASNGFADMSNRQAFVQVAGGFGQIRVGRQYTGFFNVNATHDVNGTVSAAGYLPSSNQLSTTAWTGAIRADNVISYTSPNLSGFTLGLAAASFKNKSDNTNARSAPAALTQDPVDTHMRGWTGTLSYVAGPLSAMLSYSDSKQKSAAVTGVEGPTAARVGQNPVSAVDNEQERTSFGVTYNFGVARVSLTHNRLETDDRRVTGTGANNDTRYTDTTVGVSVPFGALTVGASVGQGERTARNTATGQTVGKQFDYDAYQLLASYALSKRTNLYAIHGRDEGERKQHGANANSRIGDKTVNDGTHFGIRHSF